MVWLMQVLYPYIVLFYILDCFIFIRKHQIALVSRFGKTFCLKKAGLRFIGLSPLCRVFVLTNLPHFFTEDGIYLWNKAEDSDSGLYESSSFSYIPFSKMETVECRGEILRINRHLSFDFYSCPAAEHMMRNILCLKKLSPRKRKREIERIYAPGAKQEEIRKIRSEYPDLFHALGILGLYLFASVFIILPLFLYMNIPLHFPLFMGTLLVSCLAVLIISTWYFRKRFRRTGMTVSFFMTLLFSPVTSVHAIHSVTKHLFSAYDIISLSSVVLEHESYVRVLKKEVKKIYYSKTICREAGFVSGMSLREGILYQMLSSAGISENDLFRQPGKQDDKAARYCPFCETEFIKGISRCPDCNIDLILYA